MNGARPTIFHVPTSTVQALPVEQLRTVILPYLRALTAHREKLPVPPMINRDLGTIEILEVRWLTTSTHRPEVRFQVAADADGQIPAHLPRQAGDLWPRQVHCWATFPVDPPPLLRAIATEIPLPPDLYGKIDP